MNKLLPTLLSLPCLGLGWWLDSLCTTSAAAVRPAAASAATAPPVTPPKPPKMQPLEIPSEIHSVEEYLNLIIPGRPATTVATLKQAAARLSLEEAAGFAQELLPRWIAGLDGEDPYNVMLNRWMELAPVPALEFSLPTGRYDFGIVHHLIPSIFKNDRETAVRLLGMFHLDCRGDMLITRGNCIETMEGTDPQEALAFIVDMDAKTRGDWQESQYIGAFAGNWIQSDAVAAINWALKQRPSFTREQILAQMAGAWGKLDVEAARAFFDTVPHPLLPNGPLRDRILGEMEQAAPLEKSR